MTRCAVGREHIWVRIIHGVAFDALPGSANRLTREQAPAAAPAGEFLRRVAIGAASLGMLSLQGEGSCLVVEACQAISSIMAVRADCAVFLAVLDGKVHVFRRVAQCAI